MRFSRNWIAAYTDLPAEPRAMTESLSMLGLVVDDARPEGDDLILDLDLPSNRPDVLNHHEIAREVAVASGGELRTPAADFEAAGEDSSAVSSVAIEDGEGCTRFVARALFDVEVGPSPEWMCARLESIGLRPINNVVDVTNYVMWELGRPMHAYDLDKLAGNALVVRRARDGERVVTLDEVERELTADDLVIADADAPVGLAGVMGGAHTGVTEGTTRVLLECACFAPGTVRQMARRHGMHTDASHRFERGMSHEGIDEAVDRACALLAEQGAARVGATGIDVVTAQPERHVIKLRRQRLASYLGVQVEPDAVVGMLRGLGFEIAIVSAADPVDGYSAGDYAVTVPLARQDVTREVDLIEEVARFHGYDRLPNTLPTLRRADRHGAEPVLRRQRHLVQVAAALGFWEAITFAFTSESVQRPFLEPDDSLTELANPLSEAMAVMRRRLLPGLLGALALNLNQGSSRVRLFETGRTFIPDESGRPVERRHLALLLCGTRRPSHFADTPQEAGMVDLKGAVDAIAHRMGWPAPQWNAGEIRGFQPGTAAVIVNEGVTIGFAGKLSAEIAAHFGIESEVWAAEADIEQLLNRPRPGVEVTRLPRYPASSRDVSLTVPPTVVWSQIEASLQQLDAPLLVSHELVDTYRGGDEALTVTIRLTYRSADRTLTAEEIETAHEAAVSHLVGELGLQRP